MRKILKPYCVLFPDCGLEMFKYFLNFASYYTGFSKITEYESLKELVATMFCTRNIGGDRATELISDIAMRHEDDESVFRLLKVVCCLANGPAIEKLASALCADSREQESLSLLSEVLTFKYSYICDCRLVRHFQPSVQALQPEADVLLAELKSKYVSELEAEFSVQQTVVEEDLQFAEIMAISDVCAALSCLPREEEIVHALDEVQYSQIGNCKFRFLKDVVESRIAQFVQEELEELLMRLHAPEELVGTSAIFCLEKTDFGQRKYDRFSIFEADLFLKSMGSGMFTDFEVSMHRLNWALRLCNMQGSNQLKLCSIDIILGFERLFRREVVDLREIEQKIQNSFFPAEEFSFHDMFGKKVVENALEVELNFAKRQRELQKQYVYREMLDNCVLTEKRERMLAQQEAEHNTYRRLDNFDVVLNQQTRQQIEIGLGYSADKQLVLDLIDEMKNQFCKELDYSEEEFERVLRRSAPNLLAAWLEANTHTESPESQKEEHDDTDVQLAELEPPMLLEAEAEEPENVLFIQEAPQTLISIAKTIAQDSQSDAHLSLQNYSMLTNNSYTGSYSDEDFFFNAEECVKCLLSPVRVFDTLMQKALLLYYYREGLNFQLLSILQFYFAENSLQVADFQENGTLPRFIAQGEALFEPKISGLERLPLDFYAIQNEIRGKAFYFAKCDPINAFILNPIYSGLNTAFWRLTEQQRLLLEFSEIRNLLKSDYSRRGRVVQLLCFKMIENIAQKLSGQLFYIKERLDELLEQRTDAFFDYMQQMYEVIADCCAKTESLYTNEDIIRICGAIERFMASDDEITQARLVVELKTFVLGK